MKKNNLILEKTLKQINSLSPDLILFTGDLVNNFFDEVTENHIVLFNKYLSGFDCYSILGNHDYGNYSDWNSAKEKEFNFSGIISSHEKLGFHLLRNDHVVIKEANDSIFLLGVENWGHHPFPKYADLEEAKRGINDNSFKILLTHDPSHWQSHIRDKEDIQLTLSGHTHGLQWGIKIAGIPFSLSKKVRKNWGGLYTHGCKVLNVNRGIGTVGIPWRIDMPAEISLITLKCRKVNRQ